MFINTFVSQRVLSKLTSCQIAAQMRNKFCALYLKRIVEDVFTILGRFYDYKMSCTDDIASHIQHINDLALLLQDLGHDLPTQMISSKIITNLSPSYNNIIVAWSYVLETQQMVDYLEDCFL